MSSLDRAVAFGKRNHIAMLVPEDLDLNMARTFQVPFEIDSGVGEIALRLATAAGEGIRNLGFRPRHPESPSATSPGCLDRDRVAMRVGPGSRLIGARYRLACTGNGLDPRLYRGLPRPDLVAHREDAVG